MTSIESAAWAVSMAEQALSAAEEVHLQRMKEVEVIESRLAEAEAKCKSIREQCKSGEISESEAGGRYAMSVADRDDLAFLHAEALRAVRDAEPVKQRNDLNAARQRLERAKNEAEIEALSSRAVEIDAALTGVLREIASANYRLSHLHSFGSRWSPSPELREAVTLNRAPR